MRANLQDMKRLGVRVVDFTGGEPLLHRQLGDFLTMAKQLGLLTTVTTNGLLYPKYAHTLQGKVDMLHFSLDSADRDTHNTSRGVACYDHVMESLDLALALGERPDVLFTVGQENAHEIVEIYEKITRPRGLMLILNPMFAYGEVAYTLQQHFDLLRHWARQPDVYLNEAFLTLREHGGNQTADPVCVAASSTIVISPENKLLLPCYHLGTKAFDLNNNLYSLWHSPEVEAIRKLEGRMPECQGCTINCYMQPSFAYQVNQYFWKALPSTLKYTLEKWVY